MSRRYRDYNPLDVDEDDYREGELQRRINEQYNRGNGGDNGIGMLLFVGLVCGIWAFGASITGSSRPIQVVPNPGLSDGSASNPHSAEYYQRTQGGTVYVDPNAASPPVGWSGSPSVTGEQYRAMGRGGMYQDPEEVPCTGPCN